MIFEIVILAMIAAFLGMRLYSVLGRRAEHEEEHAPRRFDAGTVDANAQPQVQPRPSQPAMRALDLGGAAPALEAALRDIGTADRRFDIPGFVDGAKQAYGMILDAFWQGDRETLQQLCDDDVYAGFAAAIDMREAAGETLDNRLIRIEEAKIDSATLDGKIARVGVHFIADIASVTRDRNGAVIAGSLDDAIESRDVWIFSRDVTASGPDWLLDETDEG